MSDGQQVAPSRLAGHSLVYLVGTALQGLGVLLVLPFATKLLGDTEFGRVATALVIVQMVGTIAAAGLPQVILREFHRGDDGPTAGRALAGTMALLALALAVLGLALGGALAAADRVDFRQWALVVVGSAALTTVVSGQTLSRARLKPFQFLVLAVLSTLVAHLSGLLAARDDRSSVTYLTAYTVALVVAAAAAVAIGRPLLPTAARQRVRKGLRLAAPLLPQAAAMLGLLMGDVLLANHLGGSAAAGSYQAALQLGNVPFVFAVALFNAWGPLVLSRPTTDRWEWTSRTGTALVTAVVIGAGMVAAASPFVVRIFVQGDFDIPSIWMTTAIIAAVAPLYMLYQGSSLAVLDSERTSRLAIAALVAVAVLIGGSYLLEPSIGIAGIAIAKVAAYATLAALTIAAGWTHLRWPTAAWVAVTLAMAACAVSSTAQYGAIAVGVLLVVTAAAIAPRLLRTLRG